MKAQVLITGGSTGIGLGLAQRYLKAGARVMITGRDPGRLIQAAKENPGLEIFVNDISVAEQRRVLAQYIAETMPGVNILINNAGIQRRVSLAADHESWDDVQREINVLLSAPVHLNQLLIPLLLTKAAMIVNVTSGGAYIPQVFAPIYSACKAALHHYTLILRHALSDTSCKVVELIPPAVKTALAGPGLIHGVPLNEFCDGVFKLLLAGKSQEIGFGPTAELTSQLNGQPLEKLFKASAAKFPVEIYKA